MALLWLQRAELALFAAAFLCGAVAAAALTRTQVRRRGGAGRRGVGVGVGKRGGGPVLTRDHYSAGRAASGRRAQGGGNGPMLIAFCGSVCPGHASVIPSLGKRTSLLERLAAPDAARSRGSCCITLPWF